MSFFCRMDKWPTKLTKTSEIGTKDNSDSTNCKHKFDIMRKFCKCIGNWEDLDDMKCLKNNDKI